MKLNMTIKTSTGLYIIVAASVLTFGGFFTYFFLTNSDTKVESVQSVKPTVEAVTSMDDTVLPDFSDIRKVVKVDNEKWVATSGIIKLKDNKIRLYTQKDGLPGSATTDIVVFKNEIWAGFQGGVARYNTEKDSFSPFLDGESNVSLFVDPYENNLYASAFKSFFEWNGTSWDKKEGANLPIDSHQIMFTKDYIASSSFPAHPVVLFDRATKTWTKPEISEFGAQQGQTLFQAKERTFIYGRSKNYQSCDDANKEASSTFFELKNGQWEAVSSLNEKFGNSEPLVKKDSESSEKRFFIYSTDSCSGKTNQYKQVEVDFSGNNIRIGAESDYKYEDALNPSPDITSASKEIARASGFSPYKEIKAIDDNGVLLAKTMSVSVSSTTPNSMIGFSVIKPTKDGYKEQTVLENNKDNPSYMTPILCSRSQGKSFDYLLAQEIEEMGGTTLKADLYSISKDFVAKKITPQDNSVIKSISTNAACKDDTLFWQSPNKTIKSLNLKNNTVKEIPISLNTETNFFNQNAIVSDAVWMYDPKTKKIARYVLGADKTEEVIIDPKVAKQLTNESKLLAVTESNLWLVTTNESSNASKKVYALDLAGKETSSFDINNEISSLIGLSNDYILGKKRLGAFTTNIASPSVKLLSNSILPFWGKGAVDGQDFSSFDRISYNFIRDSKFNKIWFTNSGMSFSLNIDTLIK